MSTPVANGIEPNETLGIARIGVVEVLLLAFLFFLPLWPQYAVVKVDPLPGINVQRVLLALTLMYWLAGLASSARRCAHCAYRLGRRRGFVLILSVAAVLKLLSVLGSPSVGPSLFSAISDVATQMGLFLVAYHTWKHPKQIRRAASVWAVSATIVGLLALYESSVERNLFANIVPVWSENTVQATDAEMRSGYRVQATFASPLALAQFAALTIPIAIAVFREGRGLIVRSIGAASALVMIVAAYYTGSRALVVALVAMGGVYVLVKTWGRKLARRRGPPLIVRRLVLGPIVAACVVVATGATIWRLSTGRTDLEANSTAIRVVQLERGIPLIRAEPALGYGPGRAAEMIGLRTETVDNYYLTLALESGVLAVLLLAMAVVYVLWTAGREWRRGGCYSRLALYCAIALCGMVTYLTVLSLEPNLPFLYLLYAMILGLADAGEGTKRAWAPQVATGEYAG